MMNNRQAYFNYHIEDKYVAGIVLLGTEVKSIRDGKLSFNDAFCLFDDGELWVRGLYIAEYSHGTSNNHIAVHDRKLLFCFFKKDELFVINIHIAEYTLGTYANHDPMRQRKLLLNKRELKKLQLKLKDKGYTVVPLKVFFTDKGLVKVEIGLARGKKLHDKRETIKNRDVEKQIKRFLG